jgi:hypothetical protein
MNLLVSGTALLVIGAAIFWYYLRRGALDRYRMEPYVAGAFCVGIAISFALTLSGVMALCISCRKLRFELVIPGRLRMPAA